MKTFSNSLKKTAVLPAIAAALILLFTAAPWGQATNQSNEMWQRVEERTLDQTAQRTIIPAIYRTVRLDRAALEQALASAPMEFTRNASQNPIIHLPMPDGSLARFRFEESPVVEAELAKKYPGLKTYRAQGVDDPTATSRFDWLPTGFHAIVLSPSGTVLIDPYAVGNTTDYITYWKKNAANTAQPWECKFQDPQLPERPEGDPAPAVTSGTQLRTYRLALACTVEYATAVGGNTVAGALAAEVLIMNRVNGVYERDLAIHMNIIANNNLITYAADNTSCGGVACTVSNDPFANNDGGTMLDQNQTNTDAVIGSANYDIGHVFSTGGGGIAQLSVPCSAGNKARGVTGLTNPVGDAFAIDYVAHEMGHQWGANHTFNGTSGSCGGGNRSAGSAYEPGSGITIMAYAGICGNQDLAAHSIDTFHVKSLESIVSYSQNGTGNTCAVTTATGNTPPTATGPGTFTIPKGSPFTLTASATDPNGDTITYDWQEYDLGAATTATPNTDSDGAPRPIFRPYPASTGGSRTFPALQYILNNANVPPTFVGGGLAGELLPAITRTMTFQVVARDNRASGGGINTANATVMIDGAATPFAVTFPNTAIAVQRLTNMNVTWNASGTAANVKISLSTDGGTTFPTVLTASTPNDGSESVLIPDMPTSTARIKVEAVGNIYFDISDTNFSITTTAPTPSPTPPGGTPTATPGCPPGWAAGPVAPVVAVVRAVGVYFPANGRFYSIGGRTADGEALEIPHPLEFNPATNTWTTTTATLPDNFTNNMACGVLTVGGTPQIYCVGGSNGVATGGVAAPTARVFSYNPVTNAITTLTAPDNWPGNPTGNTILPGGFAVAGNKLYTIGSFGTATTPPTVSAEVWQFDPNAAVGSRWLARTPLPVARAYVPAATIGGLIYTAGGSNLDAGGLLIDTVESFKYDPASGIWTAIAPIPRATAETRAVVMNNQMWVLGGGRVLPNPGNQVDVFDTNSGTWSAGLPFVTGRRNFPADSDGTTHVWLAGGYDPTPTLINTMEIFSPAVCGTPTPPPTPSPTPGITPTPTPPVGPTETPTATATATATATPTPGDSVTPTPTPNPISQALNLSTRLVVQTGANVGIAGFIISGNAPKQVLIRGIGPSLTAFGVPNALANPALRLEGPAGFTPVVNNDWMDTQQAEITATGAAPTNNLESAILATLDPGSYTAILSGQDGGTGVGLVELYDRTPNSDSKLGNISTRANVGVGAEIVIAGFVLGNGIGNDTVVVRGIGPSLTAFGVPNALSDPTIEVRDGNGAVVASNNDWQSGSSAAQLTALGLAPTNPLESGLVAPLAPAAYTALLSGVNGATGVGLVEVYDNPVPGATPVPGTPTPTIPPGGTPTPTPPPGATATPTPGTCIEAFDGVTAPALPAQWVASNPQVGDGVMFVTTTTSSDTAPNNAFIPDQDGISDKVLDRPNVTVNSAAAMLTFRNNFDAEFSDGTFWDGGVLEVSTPSISNGDFLDITDSHVGGTILSGGYTGQLSGDATNPLASRLAWSGNSNGYIDTVVNMGPNLNGKVVTLRFRFGSDEAVEAPGWHIDGLSIVGASCP